MDVSLSLPLETLAQIKVVVLLFKQALSYTTFDPIEVITSNFHVLKEQLKEMVMYLYVPEFLKLKLANIIPPIHEELRQYLITMERYSVRPKFLMVALSSICFTPIGTVDYKRSAQMMYKDRNLKEDERYTIACNYCLEVEISRLCIVCLEKRYQVSFHARPIIQAWNNILTHPSNRSDVLIFEEAFYAAIEEHNVVAAEYFFKRLPDDRKFSCLNQGITKVSDFTQNANFSINRRNIKLLLFSMFEKNFWEEIKHTFCDHILTCFSFWPYQEIFMKHAISLGKHIPNSLFKLLVKEFAQNIEKDLADYDYAYLLKEMLNLYSEDYKTALSKLFSNNMDFYNHIIYLLHSK